jgi:hypothetical protein
LAAAGAALLVGVVQLWRGAGLDRPSIDPTDGDGAAAFRRLVRVVFVRINDGTVMASDGASPFQSGETHLHADKIRTW